MCFTKFCLKPGKIPGQWRHFHQSSASQNLTPLFLSLLRVLQDTELHLPQKTPSKPHCRISLGLRGMYFQKNLKPLSLLDLLEEKGIKFQKLISVLMPRSKSMKINTVKTDP